MDQKPKKLNHPHVLRDGGSGIRSRLLHASVCSCCAASPSSRILLSQAARRLRIAIILHLRIRNGTELILLCEGTAQRIWFCKKDAHDKESMQICRLSRLGPAWSDRRYITRIRMLCYEPRMAAGLYLIRLCVSCKRCCELSNHNRDVLRWVVL